MNQNLYNFNNRYAIKDLMFLFLFLGNQFVIVKKEREDEAEIREMAAKMVEQQRAKMANAVPSPMAAPSRPGSLVAPGQPGITSFFKNNKGRSTSPDTSKKNQEKPPLDEFSQRGRT